MPSVNVNDLKRGNELLITTDQHDYIITICWPHDRVGILKTTGDRRFKKECVVQYDESILKDVGTMLYVFGIPILTPPVRHLEVFGDSYSYEIF